MIALWIFLGFFTGLMVWRTMGILEFRKHVAWETASRRGLNYYGLPLAERKKFRDALQRKARFLLPLLSFESKLQRLAKAKPFIPSMEYRGVTGPSYSCTVESFEAAVPAVHPA